MYMANHNLNTQIDLAGTELLVPTTVLMNETNAVNGTGSLGLMANNCAGEISLLLYFCLLNVVLMIALAAWPHPPNFLLVDYYNEGSSPGSVFQVAALHNNVTYNRACCGLIQSAGKVLQRGELLVLTVVCLGIALFI